MSKIYDDTFTGSNGSAPNATTKVTGVGSTVDIQSNALRLLAGSGGSTSGAGAILLGTDGNPITALTNGYVRGRAVILQNPIAQQFVGILVRASNDFFGTSVGPTTGVGVELAPSTNSVYFHYFTGGTEHNFSFNAHGTGTVTATYTFTAGVTVEYLMAFNGNHFYFWIWNTGSNPPSSPQLDGTNTDITLTAGGIQAYNYGGAAAQSYTNSWDEILGYNVSPSASSDELLNPCDDTQVPVAPTWNRANNEIDAMFSSVSEDVADDADYVISPANPAGALVGFVLESHPDPLSSAGHIAHYRYQADAGIGVVDLSVDLMEGASVRKNWSHTTIPTSWVTQDQTLSGAEADSITDYTALLLKFTATARAVAPSKVADRQSSNTGVAATTFDFALSSLTVGNYLIFRLAYDNSGTSGAAPTLALSNSVGTAMGTHTEYTALQDPGNASAGVVCAVSIVKIAATSGTIRVTLGTSAVLAGEVEEWTGINATTPVVGTPVTAIGTNSLNLVADTPLTDASIALGNVAYAAIAIEGPSTDTITKDADSTGGTWTALTKVGGTNATATNNVTTYGEYKAPTAAGAQTNNPTINTVRDSAGIILELAAVTPTVKAQVSWAQLELPSSVDRFVHTLLQAVSRAGNW